MWSSTDRYISNSTTSRRSPTHPLPSSEAGQIASWEEFTKIQPRGILTIPKKLRLSVGLADNTLVRISGNKYRLIVEPVRALPYPVRTYTDNEVTEFLEFDAKETKQLKKNRLL